VGNRRGLTPRLVYVLQQGYSRRDFAADLIAGVTVGLVALPLAMAFGIASGTTPQAGIYTAIVGGFIASALGGSNIQIGGPTGAFVVVVAAIIAQHGLSGLAMVTMMAGVILILLAVTGLGTAVKYIPRPIVIGFTNGIAVLIVSTQIKDVFGLKMAEVPGGCGLDERRSPLQCGADGAGSRERRGAACRRHPRDRRHRANGDELPLRCAHAGGGHRARVDAARGRAACGASRATRAHGHARRRPVRRRLQHGGVVGDPGYPAPRRRGQIRVAYDLPSSSPSLPI
jgi:sulfate permease family protein